MSTHAIIGLAESSDEVPNRYQVEYVRVWHDGYPSHILSICHRHLHDERMILKTIRGGDISSINLKLSSGIQCEREYGLSGGKRSVTIDEFNVQEVCDHLLRERSDIAHVYLYDVSEEEWVYDFGTRNEIRDDPGFFDDR
jgi:hypothetical protein